MLHSVTDLRMTRERKRESPNPEEMSANARKTIVDKQLQDEICAAIAERFGTETEKLVPEATMESLNIDSLSMIEFMFEMEDKLGINLSDSREPLKTLADVFAEIDKALQAKQASGS